jgi:predicted phosphodiesterase
VSSRDQLETARARYYSEASASLTQWLDSPLPPTLCFSDTHLVPRPFAWSDDAPEDLLGLIESLPDHEILSLGDLTESIGIGASERALFDSSDRLARLFDGVASRRCRIVVGNHDANGVEFLERRFGAPNVTTGGFDLGRVRIRHGHEAHPLKTRIEALVGPLAVPIFERLRRGKPPERLDNATVLRSVRGPAPFVLFGHTHSAMLGPDAANPGCFLGSAQSFLTIEGYEITLFKRG